MYNASTNNYVRQKPVKSGQRMWCEGAISRLRDLARPGSLALYAAAGMSHKIQTNSRFAPILIINCACIDELS